MEFLSGETKKWINIALPNEPQEYPEEHFFIVLDRPKGGARIKVFKKEKKMTRNWIFNQKLDC